MKHRTPVVLFLFAFCLAGQSVPQRGRGHYSVVLKLPLTQTANGVDGYLELLDDSRLTPKLRDQTWNTGAFEIGIDGFPKRSLFP
jgi:hypothetical protein